MGLISPAVASKWRKKIETFTLLRVARNGSEATERPKDRRMTVHGVVERLENGEDLRFGRPGQHPNIRRCQISSGPREGKKGISTFPVYPSTPL